MTTTDITSVTAVGYAAVVRLGRSFGPAVVAAVLVWRSAWRSVEGVDVACYCLKIGVRAAVRLGGDGAVEVHSDGVLGNDGVADDVAEGGCGSVQARFLAMTVMTMTGSSSGTLAFALPNAEIEGKQSADDGDDHTCNHASDDGSRTSSTLPLRLFLLGLPAFYGLCAPTTCCRLAGFRRLVACCRVLGSCWLVGSCRGLRHRNDRFGCCLGGLRNANWRLSCRHGWAWR